MTVYFNISSWSPSNVVGGMGYNISDKDTNATVPTAVWIEVNSTDVTDKYGKQFATGVNITKGGDWKNLWLKLQLLSKDEVSHSAAFDRG